MMFAWEVQEAVSNKTGIRLEITDYTQPLTIAGDPERGYLSQIIGPFIDLDAPEPTDLRIFVVVRELDGQISFDLLVQDADDDAFLNSNAQGVEKYDFGPVKV